MFRRLATYPIAFLSATAYAAINVIFDVHGAADVAVFAVCVLVGGGIAVPLALSAPQRPSRRRRVSGTT